MKKNIIVLLGCAAISLLTGCLNSDKQTIIDSQTGEQSFNNQIEKAQYIQDFEDFISYNILSASEDKSYNSDFFITAKFDKNSSVQGGVEYSQKKLSKTHDLESSDIEFSVQAENAEKNTEPFDISGSISLLYKDNEMYANLHRLGVFMGEGNMTAKMYTLLGDLIIDKWVDLEVNEGGIITVDDKENIRLSNIVGTLKNVLKTQNIETNPDFLGSIAELIEFVNSYIDLGISTDELRYISGDASYSKFSNGDIQKSFTGSFEGKLSTFDLSFIASINGLEITIYNIKEYDEDISKFNDKESSFSLSLQQNKKSEYSVIFESIKSQQKVASLQGKIKYADTAEFSASFELEPLEIISGQKISGDLEGYILKKSGEADKKIYELTGDILLLSELLSSL